MDLESELRAIVQKKVTNGASILSATKLAEIGLDSIDVVEIVFEIEDKFQIQLPQNNEEMASATFQDLCRLVEERIADKTAAVPDPRVT